MRTIRQSSGLANQGLSTNTAPSLGPLIGGLLTDRLGWRAIFWFLAIASGVCLAATIFTLPESGRNVVGNGSIQALGVHRLPFPRLFPGLGRRQESSKSRRGVPNPLTCIYCLLRKNTAIIVTCIGVLYMINSCLQASLSALFVETYYFTESQAGLIYLPSGIGCAIAAVFTGKLPPRKAFYTELLRFTWIIMLLTGRIGRLLDRDYRLTARSHGLVIDRVRGDDLLLFPIELARLRSFFYAFGTAMVAVVGYGWSVQAKFVHVQILASDVISLISKASSVTFGPSIHHRQHDTMLFHGKTSESMIIPSSSYASDFPAIDIKHFAGRSQLAISVYCSGVLQSGEMCPRCRWPRCAPNDHRQHWARMVLYHTHRSLPNVPAAVDYSTL